MILTIRNQAKENAVALGLQMFDLGSLGMDEVDVLGGVGMGMN